MRAVSPEVTLIEDFGRPSLFRQQGDQRLVGLALFGHIADAHLDMDIAIGAGLDTVYLIAAAIRRQPDGQSDMVCKLAPGAAHIVS